jgi:hypothetical protein
MSTLHVVEEVLRERRVPMVVREIVEAAGPKLPSKSKTPDTVVARDLAMDIKRRGEASKFIRVSPGRYTLKELVPDDQASAAASPAPAEPLAPGIEPIVPSERVPDRVTETQSQV